MFPSANEGPDLKQRLLLAGGGHAHLGVLEAFALQAFFVAAAAAWQAHTQNAPHLFVTAAIALTFKGLIIPIALMRIVRRLNIHRSIETALGVNLTLLAGVGLVALSIVLVFPVTAASGALTAPPSRA